MQNNENRFVLIGGGEIGRNNTKYETREIDEEIVKMTGKERPIFLFIGLASSFSDSYYDVIKKIYQNLGCETVYLKKKNIINNPNIVKEKIARADIIYMCGGDTTKLVNTIREYKIDELFKNKCDCVFAGISAGAICFTNSGFSDYLILNNIADEYSFTDGLGLIDLDICPHGDNPKRISDLKEAIKNTDKKVLILDNGIALKVENAKASIITSIKNNSARFGYWSKDKWIEKRIDKSFKI